MASPVIQASDLGDMGKTTLPELNKGRLVEIISSLRKFYVMGPDGILNKEHVETAVGGKSFQWDVVVNDQGSFGNVGLAYQDNPAIVDTTVQATADWRHSKVDYAMIAQEMQFNMGPAQIVDLEMVREKTAIAAMVQGMEGNWFGPTVSSTDTVTPWGMKTWITRPRTYVSDGFVGSTYSSGPSTLGLDPATQPNWRNYFFKYTNVSDDDFVRRLAKAFLFTEFEPPVEGLPLLNGRLSRKCFTNWGLMGPLQELLKASNQDLGMDILKYQNATVIQGIPLVQVPYLESDSSNPIYFVDFGAVKLYRLKNFWMRRTQLPFYPGQHNMKATFIDSTYQFVFVTRRTSGCGATSETSGI